MVVNTPVLERGVTLVLLLHGREIWMQSTRAFGDSKKIDNYTGLIWRYKSVPMWWFHILLVGNMITIFTCHYWWGGLLACAISILFTLPIGTFGTPFLPLPKDSMRCDSMVLITSLFFSCIRNVKLLHLRRAAILLLQASALYIDDEDRLQRVIPYVIAMLLDPAAIVCCAALETLCDILPLVRDFPPSDAKIFPEYILPILSILPDDPEESVRICYASNIAKWLVTAYGFLIHSISLSEAGVLDELSLPQKPLISSTQTSGRMKRINSDVQLLQLRKSIADVVQELVMGPKQTPNIRRALLQDIGELCYFFGVRQSNDSLLPIRPVQEILFCCIFFSLFLAGFLVAIPYGINSYCKGLMTCAIWNANETSCFNGSFPLLFVTPSRDLEDKVHF